MRYGVIGLGHLGEHLARNLMRHGFVPVVHDLNRDSAASLLSEGASWADSPKEVASQVDAVITCLPTPKASDIVVTGQNGVVEGLAKGGTWIEMSTNDAVEIKRIAALLAENGLNTLECPVTGGVHLARDGQMTALVGGDTRIFDMHRPAIQAMCGEIFHMGPLGSATLIKVITNTLACAHTILCGEALMLAKKGGLDLAQSFHAIMASSGRSFVIETEGQLILNGSYDIGWTLDLAIKDVGFALRYAREMDLDLEVSGMVEQILQRAKAEYGGSAMSTRVVQLLEDAVGTDLRAPGFPASL